MSSEARGFIGRVDMPNTYEKSSMGRFWTHFAAISVALICFGFSPSAALGAFEQVSTFAGSASPVSPPFAEEVQLGGVGGMAVNYTGAGGVPAGTVYAATKVVGEPTLVAMYLPAVNADLELRPEFSVRWEVTNFGGPYARCGPAAGSTCSPRSVGAQGIVDVDIDQSTGNVYVFDGGSNPPGKKYISVYTPNGAAEITRFGERVASIGETAKTPDQIHGSPFPGAIAVNDVGEVYLFDQNAFDGFYRRLMKFTPKSPGEPEEGFEYAGVAEDVGAGFGVKGQPSEPVMDAAGNIYVASQEARIEMYSSSKLSDPPVCTFESLKGGITGLTVDPLSGNVFFFSFKKEAGFSSKTVHHLSPCDPETGKFGEVGQFEVSPERDDLWGFAFDPGRQFSPTRTVGVLYGGAPSQGPSSGEGTGEEGQSSLGYIFAPLEENPPAVSEETVSGVTATSAQLRGVVDPNGFKTHYVFEYLSDAAYQGGGGSFDDSVKAPIGGAFLQGTEAVQGVGVALSGLFSDTTYRFRIVATSNCSPSEEEKVCESVGSVRTFHTYPFSTAGPAGGRGYELVSPTEKHSGQVLPAEPGISSCLPFECKPGETYEHFPMQSAPSGDSVVFEGSNFGEGVGATLENAYLARRTTAGWQTTNLTPSLLQKGARGYLAYDIDLTNAVLAQQRPSLSPIAPPEYENLYSQAVADPLALQPLVATQPSNRTPVGVGEFEIRYAGASADLSRVFFTANDALTEETPFAPAAADGGPTKSNLYEWERSSGQLRLVNVAPGNASTQPGASFGVPSANTISADGSKAFWSDESGQLFVRENAEETLTIPGSGPSAEFLSAATDGSKVLLSNGQLYDLEEEATTDLTAGQGGFQGIAGQSDDLTHVYFVDTAVLSGEEENSEGAKAQAGKFNLYAWEEGATHLVATLVGGDNAGANITQSRSWSPFPFARTAQASPQGRYLAFLSEAKLISDFDNTGPCVAVGKEAEFIDAPCPEAFFYDSVTGDLLCASCNDSGASSLGWSVLRRIKAPGAVPEPTPQPRYLLDSGRLYFDTQESLSQFDTNEGVEDVYEFRPQGVESCERQGGCQALISSGRDGSDSNLLAIDATGANVFFTSRDRLVAADRDELIDLYVARVGGGFPEKQEEPVVESPLQTPPFEPTPASPTLTDPGNVPPPKPCKKGQVRKKGKCVKKHKPKKSGKKARRGDHR